MGAPKGTRERIVDMDARPGDRFCFSLPLCCEFIGPLILVFRILATASSALGPLVFVLLLHFSEVGLAFGLVLLGTCCTWLFGC